MQWLILNPLSDFSCLLLPQGPLMTRNKENLSFSSIGHFNFCPHKDQQRVELIMQLKSAHSTIFMLYDQLKVSQNISDIYLFALPGLRMNLSWIFSDWDQNLISNVSYVDESCSAECLPSLRHLWSWSWELGGSGGQREGRREEPHQEGGGGS